ncbi:hypothetical protein N4P33_19975 [Streptomyces sp. 15-116A]|uniref:hypothetical protein n=1 Tax=Streptomyces sp. 15-116A TaxID=2259035 RepID=UPI0021B3E5BB|nr:hypothetical protein [Streptomyces sp. 15-116A]MCT7354415.1 hypothetical protein [Streptomyces sp. 15-116A]
MAAPAYVPSPALSKPWAEPSSAAPEGPHASAGAEGLHACVFSAEGPCTEVPLTSEPPLPDAEPLTSEPPLADTAPMTSESDGFVDYGTDTDPSGLDAFPAQYRPEP